MGNSNNDLISVVVPTYNREKLIGKTIDSVLNQTYKNLELIVVDDASNDNTQEVIARYNDRRLRYIKLKKNSNGTRPRNIGIEQSKGKYIALLDSDDEWVATKLEKQLQYIKEYEGKDFLCFTDIVYKQDDKETVSKNDPISEKDNIMDYILLKGNSVQTSSYFFPSELGKRTMFGHDVKKHQDWDFCVRLQKQGTLFISLDEPLTIYNIDKRNDRIATNSKYDLSLEWIDNVKSELSEKAYYAFLVKYVATTLIFNKGRMKAIDFYVKAFTRKAINLNGFIKGLIKCVAPIKVLRKIVNL